MHRYGEKGVALNTPAAFEAARKSLDRVLAEDAGGDPSLLLELFTWALEDNPSDWYREQVKSKRNPVSWMTSGKVWTKLIARYNLAYPMDGDAPQETEEEPQ